MLTTSRRCGLIVLLALLGLVGRVPGGAEEPPAAGRGRVAGRFLDAATGQPIAGAKIKVLVQGVPVAERIRTAVSDGEGRYALDVPWGHANFWGVQTPNELPPRRTFLLKQRCCGDTFHGPVVVPPEAGPGIAKVAVKVVGWPGQHITPALVQVPIEDE